ncbi:rho GTPase-activating protein 32-like [Tympanuchus pallidicinctus]|uniref:rho GTPase-activating protein 32-like n=1 Tax=Tympanuchus pallidicinctus TaxID=109042 RepID=UPI0022874DAA|nr:rho GTPase-activating protein 32-like [Tympanuchus pallidicinctus]
MILPKGCSPMVNATVGEGLTEVRDPDLGYGMRFIAKVLKDSRHDKFPDAGEDELLKLVVPAVMGIACSEISCEPGMTRMEAENNGKPLLVREESSLNIPAIAAAHVIKRYVAQAPGELSLEVGDLVCVIEMPPQELSPRWRGKHGFQVGFFPGECVELINGKIPESLINSVPKPVPKKRGKLLTFLRSVVKARPKQRKEREVEKERVFGRDLGEHLLHSGRDVPQVLQSCAEFIEQHGVVQGIYRLSGVASNVQRLRQEFECEQVPELTVRDVHSASSLCKMYFRELPTPLLTDQLYDKFSDAVGATTEEERLVRMRDVIQQLPAPHYRTLVFLMRHLACLAANSSVTNMHSKNLAIVWAPNLLRSQQSESACASGRAACTELQTQSAVVEFIIDHTDVLFCSTSGSDIADGAGHSSLSGPQSVQASSPATELLSLEEAQARRRGHSSSPVVVTESSDVEVEEGPTAVRGKFHTVIDFPPERPSPPSRMKESPAGCWCSCFSLGKPSSVAKRQLQRRPREPSETDIVVLAGDSSSCQPRCPRASSDAGLCASTNGELLGSTNGCGSADSLPHNNSGGHKELIQVQALVSPSSAEDADLSLSHTTGTSLDCDPVPLQCSPAQAQPECPDSSTSVQEQVSNSEEKPCPLEGDLESGLQSQAPCSGSESSEPLSP